MTRTKWIAGAAAGALAALFAAGPTLAQTRLTDVTIVYPTPGSTSWPIWMAKDGGYFEKYGLNVKVEFGLHPAGPAAVASGGALTHNLGLDTSMLAAMQGDQIVLISAPLHVGQFVLLGAKDITDVKTLATKRIAVGRVGDPPYFYANGLLDSLKIDTRNINWVSAGAPPERALAVRNGLADAAMLTPPDYYRLVDDGFKLLANLADHRNVPVATSYMFLRRTVQQNPQLVEAVLKGHIEGVKRFYDDKAFAMATISKYSRVDDQYLGRLYDETAKANVLERVPFVPKAAVDGIIARGKAETPALATFDFRRVIDQTFLERLADSGYFEQVYGSSIRAELAERKAGAFR